MEIGTELRNARIARGLSLSEISARTKIGVGTLTLIENNQFDRLPSGVFTRGFLMAYAREVGGDPSEIAARYTTELRAQQEELERERLAATRVTTDEPERPALNEAPRASHFVAVIVLAGAAFFLLARWQGTSTTSAVEAPAEQVAVAADGVSSSDAPGERAAATTGVPDALGVGVPDPLAVGPSFSSGAHAQETAVRIELAPEGPCWIEAAADGTLVVYRLMDAGDRQTIDARETIQLKVGDPGALRFTVNGQPGRPLGPPGQPVTIRITPDNLRDLT
jgi:transcriptional regulator with XRE-family HTH domain